MKHHVKGLRVRRDGWTPARQRAFLESLASTGSVGRAAEAVGLSRASAYAMRRHPGAEGFAAAWDAAHRLGLAAAKAGEVAAISRPVIRRGKVVAFRTVFRDPPGRVGLRAIHDAVARLDSASVNFRTRAGREIGAAGASGLSTSAARPPAPAPLG